MNQTTNELRALDDLIERVKEAAGDYHCWDGDLGWETVETLQDYRRTLARHEQAQGGMADDSARLDALEAFVRDNGGLVLHDHDARGNYPGLGLASTRRTLREAIDGAFRPSADARQETQG